MDQDVERPPAGQTQTILAFKDLPTDTPLTLNCDAKGGLAPTDLTLLGTASDSVTIRPGVPAVAALNLQSTISSLEIDLNGASPTSDFHMFRGESAAVTVQAKDAEGAMVPIAPDSLTLSVSGANLSLTGTTAKQLNTNDLVGTGILTAVEAESGKSAQINIVVDKRIGVKTVLFVPAGPYQLIRKESQQLVAKGFDEDNIEVPTAVFTYSLQNATGITLNGDTITATDAGSATIVVTETTSGVQATTTVTALAHGTAVRMGILDANNVEIVSSLGVAKGTIHQFHVESFDSLGNFADTPTNVQWTLDEPGNLGNFNLNSNGKLTVKSNAIFGSATITATAKVNTPNGLVDMTQSITVFIDNSAG